MIRFLPIAGTWGSDTGWVIDDADPWNVFMHEQGCEALRRPDGSPWFTWPAKLAGLPFLRKRYWRTWAEHLAMTLVVLPYESRNLLAHSHGGQLAILTAARGVPIRSLTTIATPRRHDVPAELAAPHIGYWQHVFDPQRDWIGAAKENIRRGLGGQIGDGVLSTERRFLIDRVQNIGIPSMSHSRLFTPDYFHWWIDAGILDGIRSGPDKRVA